MTIARRIARNRRHETAIYAGLAKFEVAARSDTDPERSKERMRILGKVREFALHVKEPDLDKAWAYLCESRKGYSAKKDGLSDLMSAVDDWQALDGLRAQSLLDAGGYVALCDICRATTGCTEECTKGHAPRECEACGAPMTGGCSMKVTQGATVETE